MRHTHVPSFISGLIILQQKKYTAYLYPGRGVVERSIILESILHDLFGQWLKEHAIVYGETRQQHACVVQNDEWWCCPIINGPLTTYPLLTEEKTCRSKHDALPKTHGP